MNALDKLGLLGPAACYEPAEEVGATGSRLPSVAPAEFVEFIHRAVMPGGQRIALLKTMYTSACEKNCNYCPFRAGRDFRRATFSPDELAKIFLQLYHQDIAEGLFLSSALVGGGPRVQDRLIDTAELLRRGGFKGYIHLKIMPGAERDQVAAAMRLADRVSVNLEAPNTARLGQLAPQKAFDQELLQRLQWIAELRQEMSGRRPSATTQFVVGAVGESDLELLSTTAYLYRELRLARAYFSSFRPVSDTPLEGHPPSSPQREHRLYQASFLLRDYGFEVEELPFESDANLPTTVDPKVAWARQHLEQNPVEVNRADRRQLLRVPGIGLKGAERLLGARRLGRLRDLAALRKLGIAADRAAPFILLDGRRAIYQLSLWPV